MVWGALVDGGVRGSRCSARTALSLRRASRLRPVDVANAGGTFTETDGTTGEILDQWEAGPQPGERPLN